MTASERGLLSKERQWTERLSLYRLSSPEESEETWQGLATVVLAIDHQRHRGHPRAARLIGVPLKFYSSEVLARA